MEILHDHATSETSDSICQGVKSSCENTRLYIGTTCASYRPVDPNIEGTNLSTEVSAIYFAMKNSKLECIDERGQDSMSAEVYYEDEDSEEFDEFDPYLFIKNLPDLSSVVPSFRPMLLPKQTRSCPPTTLVLDLDGENVPTYMYTYVYIQVDTYIHDMVTYFIFIYVLA